MKAIILCAGYATRLYPLTLDKPKALLPIKGKPLLDYTIAKIPNLIEDITIVSNDKFYDNFARYAEKYKGRIRVLNDRTTSNENRLGGIGDLYFAIKKENIKDDILVILGDNLFDFYLSGFIDYFNKVKKTLVGAYEFSHEELKKLGVIEARNNKIVGFEEKPKSPKSNLASTGLYIFTRENIKDIEKYMKSNNDKDKPGFLIEYLYQKRDIFCYIFKGKWLDIGSKEMYEEVNRVWE